MKNPKKRYQVTVELSKYSKSIELLHKSGFSTFIINRITKAVTPFTSKDKVIIIPKNYQIHCIYNGTKLPDNIIKTLEDDIQNVLFYNIEKRVF